MVGETAGLKDASKARHEFRWKETRKVLIHQIPGIMALICEDSLTCREGRMWSMVEWLSWFCPVRTAPNRIFVVVVQRRQRSNAPRGLKLHVTTMSEQSLYPLPPLIPSRSSSVGQRHDSEGLGKFKVRTPVSQRRGKDAPNNEDFSRPLRRERSTRKSSSTSSFLSPPPSENTHL